MQQADAKPCTIRKGTPGAPATPGPDYATTKSQVSISRGVSEGGSSGAVLAETINTDDRSYSPPSPSKPQTPAADIRTDGDDSDMLDGHATDGGAAAVAAVPASPDPVVPAPPTLLHPAPPSMYAPLTAYAAAAPPAPLPFAAMLTVPPPQARLETLIGTSGSVQAVAALNGHGLVVSGNVGGVPFSGVIGSTPALQYTGNGDAAAAAPPAAAAAAAEPPPGATKRARLTPQPRLLPPPRLPDTVEALLARLSLCVDGGPVASAAVPSGGALGSTQGERAAAMWMRLDPHKRDLVQQAVRADEDRYKTEVQARDAAMVRDAATRRRDDALRAAEETMTNVCPPHSVCIPAPPHSRGVGESRRTC